MSLIGGATAASEALSPDQFLQFDSDKAKIGQLLFYDKILSGNRNIACATCHHHDLHGADALSLGIGEGGVGLGKARVSAEGADKIDARIPRNAPALWNLGHESVTSLFHDGRVEISNIYGNGFDTPAEERLPQGLDSILAAQALFPMTSHSEMAGQSDENEISGAVNDRIDGAWPILAKRVRQIPEYGDMFVSVFPNIQRPEDVGIVEIGNAIAAFIGTEWQSFDSAYDDYLVNGTPLPDPAERGRALFFGKANCSGCHSGPLLTDQEFHAVGLPQFGPGRTRPFDPMPRDVGRVGATDDLEDAYRFSTPSLRNVVFTGPYGHNGAYGSLRDMIRHMVNPVEMREKWVPGMAALPDVPWLAAVDFIIQSDDLEMQRQSGTIDLTPVPDISEQDILDLEAFLFSLSGKTLFTRPLGRPDRVPSGLPVD